jgi:hypothetical protein
MMAMPYGQSALSPSRRQRRNGQRGNCAERYGSALANRADNSRVGGIQRNKDPADAAALRLPNAEIYAIDVSFAALDERDELYFLNQQPTSFNLPPEVVDRLRAAAWKIIIASPEFQRFLREADAKLIVAPAAGRLHMLLIFSQFPSEDKAFFQSGAGQDPGIKLHSREP